VSKRTTWEYCAHQFTTDDDVLVQLNRLRPRGLGAVCRELRGVRSRAPYRVGLSIVQPREGAVRSRTRPKYGHYEAVRRGTSYRNLSRLYEEELRTAAAERQEAKRLTPADGYHRTLALNAKKLWEPQL
jgi:hypothetical protein